MAEHLTIEQLLLASDGEAGAEAESHLSSCEECRGRLEEIRQSVDDYAAYHRTTLRRKLPPPPKPWREITPRKPVRTYRWMAAAAAILIAVTAYFTARQTAPPLEATELLSRAEIAEQPSSSVRTIVVRSSKGTLVRPAVWVRTRRSADQQMQARFQRAGYSWDEPLSVRSYVAWRRTLSRKQESVRRAYNPKTSEPVYVVTTETDANPLRSATLALREQDMQPLTCTLRFDDDEVVEVEEGAAVVPGKPESPVPPSIASAPVTDPAMLELQVLSALHSVGADLGEPIQMQHENGTIILAATGISNARREQIQRALAGLQFVVPRFDAPRSAPPSTALRTEASSQNQNTALRALVEQHLEGSISFDQFVSDALDASDALSSRAYALAALATRFPPNIESGLPAPGRQLLESIRRDHLRASADHLQRLAGLLSSGFGIDGSAAPQPLRDWHSHATAFRDSVQAFDRLLTAMLTGSQKPEAALLRDSYLRLRGDFEAGVQ